MAAPKHNKYWMFRNKHGRDHKYKPEQLWDEFQDYYDWIQENPMIKYDVIRSGERAGEPVEIKMPRPLTIEGFCVFADITEHTFRSYEENKDFIPVTTRIRKSIETNQLEGASAGLYNPNIIARKLGLADKQQTEHSGKIIVKPPKWDEDK
jgi:hypothetical protein